LSIKKRGIGRKRISVEGGQTKSATEDGEAGCEHSKS